MPEPQSQETDLDLNHYLEVALRRRWIILSTLAIVFLATALVVFATRPVYQGSALLVIEKERGGAALFANGAMVESTNEDYYQTQYKLLRSYSLLQKVYEDLRLDADDDFKQPDGVDKLLRALTISPVLRSRLVYVKADSHDPRLAARVANAVAETFVQQNLANQLFISKEILQALQLKQDGPDARWNYDALPAVVNNPLVQQLKGDYARLESQAAELSQKVTARHPALIALRSNMAALRAQLRGETDKIVQSMKTELSGQLRGNNVRIVDPARALEAPVKPRKFRALLLGLLGGLALGIALGMLVESLDQTIRTQEDVEDKLSLPFLGLIPFGRVDDAHVYAALAAKEPSLTGEAFRNLRTMVDFAGVSQRSKALLVTSAVQEEGKTYVAANLAVAYAQLGERVLLIGGDLRRPKLYKNFRVSAQHGLSEYLAKSRNVAELDQLIQGTDVPGLKLLPCGPRPPNPSELLNTPRLGALAAWARTNFDRIIVDCPPMFPVNDTLLWGRHIDSAMLIVRYGRTRLRLIANAFQRLRASGVKILGVAVNAAKPGGLSYAAYGYYYQQYYHAYGEEAAGKAA